MFKKIQVNLITKTQIMGERVVKILRSNRGEGTTKGVSTMVSMIIVVLVAALIWGLIKLFIPEFWETIKTRISGIF
ncbi:hypothetical protein LJR153_007309 [Paenibacillus sp. LjRoot153]|uniref:hypothetical protein n=1 Tax=Paenibacillus sp. LjRoot153 TaxID=3342270 RepID=UPI003ECDB03D